MFCFRNVKASYVFLKYFKIYTNENNLFITCNGHITAFFPKKNIARIGIINISLQEKEIKIAEQDTTDSKDSVKITYTCTMHPGIISDKPGNCPKCGMELIKETSNEKPKEEMKMKKMGMMGMKGMGIIMGVMMAVMLLLIGKH